MAEVLTAQNVNPVDHVPFLTERLISAFGEFGADDERYEVYRRALLDPGDCPTVIIPDQSGELGAAWCRYLSEGYAADVADAAEVSISVREDAQGRGVGRALMDALIQEARHAGIGRLSLSVLDSNMVARKLYDRVGFMPKVALDAGTAYASTTMYLDL